MAPDQAAPVPAGWYPDPYGASELRWWDGQNWTDSVHPPAAPQATPPAAAPAEPERFPEPQPAAQPEPVAPEPQPVQPQPVQPQPAQPEPVQANAVQPESFPAPGTLPPPTVPPLVELAVAGPEPVAAMPEPPAPAPATGLPSRRELRARSGAGETEGPLSTTASSTPPPLETPAPLPPATEPAAGAFDWLNAGGANAPLGASAAVPEAAPVVTAAAPPAEAAAADQPAFGANAGPVPATSAWAQEPASGAADAEDLYPSTATRKSTTSAWLIALMPLIAGVLAIAAVKGAENYPRYIPSTLEWWMLAGGVVVVLYLVTIVLAVADRRKLDWSGYNRPAHWLWAILTAPVYLIVRTIAVKRETDRNSALLWVWVVLALALVGAWFAAKAFAPELIEGYELPFL